MPERTYSFMNDKVFIWLVRIALAALIGYLAVLAVSGVKSMRFIGSGIGATNTISVSGEGTVYAVPDVAEFSVTISETAKDVATAQTEATKKSNAVVDYLKKEGIAATDVQTTNYSISPHYEYNQGVCPAGSYCPSNRTLTGYDVSQTLSVKVRDTSKAGTILAGVGNLGVSNVSGLTFTVADQTKLEDQARGKAITNAQGKAQTLASQLGVTLVRVVNFSESGTPVYYAKAMSTAVGMGGAAEAAPTPQLPTGQNKITSNVNITYEIQ